MANGIPEEAKVIGELIQKRQEAQMLLKETRQTAKLMAIRLSNAVNVLKPLGDGHPPKKSVIGSLPELQQVNAVLAAASQQQDLIEKCIEELRAKGIDC